MSRPMRSLAAAMLALAAALAVTTAATAQAPYPAQPVRFLVAFAPAGPADIIGRIVGLKLQQLWGQSVVIENRAGAGGNIAAVQVARGQPDGYTVLVTTSAFAVNPSLYKNPGYAGETDFKVVGLAATTPNLIVAAPDLGVKTLKDVIALSRTKSLTFGSAGTGTTPHLSAERVFRFLAKVDIPHAPFTGAGPALNAAMGGHVALASVAMPAATELVKAGKVVPLAVTSPKRVEALPDVPTVGEAGLDEVDDATWVALFVPAKTPPEVIAKLNADLNTVIKDPDVKEQFARIGFSAMGGSQADAERYVKAEIAKWSEVVDRIGLKID
ncbi:MAG: tripartite tricarboxylate transporter substrate binding protein [Rhodoplanes sp.]|uniref:tripartite tricarboxylate transporter substrate binding protein n=1 Tax=Rhodoplanes sp. TaxID=1968906 RepID=UPI0017E4DBAC|nr:tripartite tricarboxylate transporter substrate binding protein [Rhodoplanes sp.]NVO14240.1 tripartite tricarboxylate transporter substrate binding protein [Rhodoplanes sp.]